MQEEENNSTEMTPEQKQTAGVPNGQQRLSGQQALQLILDNQRKIDFALTNIDLRLKTLEASGKIINETFNLQERQLADVSNRLNFVQKK